MRALVVVLGDLGRSPRMQYHAHALAVNGADVVLIGEAGTPLPSFLDRTRVQVRRLPPRRVRAGGAASFLWRGVLATIAGAVELFTCLRRAPRADLILVQSPPAVPTLAVAWAASRLHRARFVVDWHNLGWTLLAQRFGTGHPLVRAARWVERRSAMLADGHLAVSAALADHLVREWRVGAVTVVRDRPAETMTPAAADAVLRDRLSRQAGFADAPRPALIVSPTSWTRDEDLALIVEAADHLEALWAQRPPECRAVIVISGDGPGRAAFEARLAARPSRRVAVMTTFVPPGEYPGLVAAADAGICVHRSSSGLDLPMKLSDMRGAAVPPIVLDYGPTLREMVQPGVEALFFSDGRELADRIDALFQAWPEPSPLWRELRAAALHASAGPRWRDGWDLEARPVLLTT